MDRKQRQRTQFPIGYILITLLGVCLFQKFIYSPLMIQQQQVSYDQFRQYLKGGKIEKVTLGKGIFYSVR